MYLEVTCYIYLGVTCYIFRSHMLYIFRGHMLLISKLKIDFVQANNADPEPSQTLFVRMLADGLSVFTG